MVRYHGNEGTLTLGTVAWDEMLVGFVATNRVAEISSEKQGDTHTDTDAGLISWEVVGTFFLPDNAAPPVSGASGSMSLRYKDATTDGTIAGTALVTNVSMPYRINNNAAIDVTMKNKGAWTVTAPIA